MPLALHSPSTLDTITTIVACMLQHAFLIWRVAAPSPRLKFPVPFSSPVRGKDKYILLYDQRAENCTPSARTMLWFFFTTRLQLRSQYYMHTYKGLRIEPNLSFGIRNIFTRSCSYRIVYRILSLLESNKIFTSTLRILLSKATIFDNHATGMQPF